MKKFIGLLFAALYALFLVISLSVGFEPGRAVGMNLLTFTRDMLKVIPPAFILMGLFDVWVKKETVERHMGRGSGVRGYLWALLLAGTGVGGIYVSLPLSAMLYRKGASLGLLFAYVNASMICKIPMTLFEISFLGLKFTLVRYLVSLPLMFTASALMGHLFESHNYAIREP